MNYKYLSLTLLFSNTFLFYLYYFEQRNDKVSKTTSDLRPDIHQLSKFIKSSLKTPNAIQQIRSLLEADYDNIDLYDFYSLTERELALGVRCPKMNEKSKLNSTIVSSNDAQTNIKLGSLTQMNSSSIVRRQRTQNNFYSFALNNSIEICSDEPIDLVIMIISKSNNYKTRDATRRTWGSGKNLGPYSNIRLKVLFFLDFNDKLSQAIQLEQNLFQDIVQVKLPQQDTLVTQRVLSLLEWSLRFCRQAKFVFKTDDDIFINIILLLKFLSPLLTKPLNKSFRPSEWYIYGYLKPQPPVIRESNNNAMQRYIVNRDEFPCDNYPDHLSGFGYLIPREARDALIYAAYHDNNPFRISDVYITGILSNYLSIKRQQMLNYGINGGGDCEKFFDQPQTAYACVSGRHFGNLTDVFLEFNQLWQRAQNFM